MSKTLKIEGNCDLMISNYGDVTINSTGIENLIYENLPKLEAYKSYPATVSIVINIEEGNLDITTEGYARKQIKEDKENEAI